MLNLRQFRKGDPAFPDLLNWAALIEAGVILGKDGSLLGGFFFAGPDSDGATDSERNYLTERVNAALAQLGDGWVSWVDAVRMPAPGYPSRAASHFPDRVTTMIDNERRRHFQGAGNHFQSEYALLFQFTPPQRRKTRVAEFFYDDDLTAAAATPATKMVHQFEQALANLEDALSVALRLRRR